MKAILGRKVGMSQMFSSAGEVVPVTLILAEPNVVGLRREKERDGYVAVQLKLHSQNSKSKTQNSNNGVSREFRIEVDNKTNLLTVAQFTPGDVVEVSGVSKGKGFTGVVKRHGFSGGPASHGHRHVLRSPGSIGSRFPQHVMKGKRMAGRAGSDRVTVKNLTVMWVDTEKSLLAVKGAVPGTRDSIVEVTSN